METSSVEDLSNPPTGTDCPDEGEKISAEPLNFDGSKSFTGFKDVRPSILVNGPSNVPESDSLK